MMPFATDMDLGRAYNEAMALIPDDAWAVLIDHDAMWTTKAWHAQIVEAIARVPDAGLLTAMANRIAAPWQQVGDRERHDMAYHYALGEERRSTRTLLDVTDTKGIGGVVMIISKRAWQDVGGFVRGLLCVDHGMHFALRAARRRVYLIDGLYVYHRRRAFGAEMPKDTPRAQGCPCRGAEKPPTERLTLP
jgi:GT2 family glycosyltransferase